APRRRPRDPRGHGSLTGPVGDRRAGRETARPMRIATAVLLVGFLSSCGSGAPAMPAPGPAGGLWQDAAIFTAAGQVLGSARGRVLVEMYEFGRPDLAAALLAARARGAEVRAVLDPTVPETVATGRRLSAAGLPVRFYPVDDRAQQIDHV